jgi:hypothetical protein
MQTVNGITYIKDIEHFRELGVKNYGESFNGQLDRLIERGIVIAGEPPKVDNTCSKCGTPKISNSNYCHICGAKHD